MRERRRVGLVVLMVAGAVFLSTGCAKKQIVEKETQPPVQDGMKTEQAAGALDQARAAEQDTVCISGREAEVKAFENEVIYFDFDRYTLTPDAAATLDRKALFLKANPDLAVEVQGHCDERGTAEYNMALGDRRAEAAADYLVTMGIARERLTTVSYGEERPIDPASNEEAWAKNRRGQVVISNR